MIMPRYAKEGQIVNNIKYSIIYWGINLAYMVWYGMVCLMVNGDRTNMAYSKMGDSDKSSGLFDCSGVIIAEPDSASL